jgi:hypothetical protein
MKPNVTESIMILLEDQAERFTFTFPLCNFRTIETLTNLKFELFTKCVFAEEFRDRVFDRVIIAISNDPRIEDASDWNDLGTFRLRFELPKPLLVVDKTSVYFLVDFINGKVLEDICLVDRE